MTLIARPTHCPDCGASTTAHTGSYCHECGTDLRPARPSSDTRDREAPGPCAEGCPACASEDDPEGVQEARDYLRREQVYRLECDRAAGPVGRVSFVEATSEKDAAGCRVEGVAGQRVVSVRRATEADAAELAALEPADEMPCMACGTPDPDGTCRCYV